MEDHQVIISKSLRSQGFLLLLICARAPVAAQTSLESGPPADWRAKLGTAQVTITDTGRLSVIKTVSLVASPALTSLTVIPAHRLVMICGTCASVIAGTIQFGQTMEVVPAWTVSGVGTISTSELFAADSTVGGPYVMMASQGGVNATGEVSFTPIPNASMVATSARYTRARTAGTVANLSALRADGTDEGGVTYIWTLDGAVVEQSVNGARAAKFIPVSLRPIQNLPSIGDHPRLGREITGATGSGGGSDGSTSLDSLATLLFGLGMFRLMALPPSNLSGKTSVNRLC